MIIITVNSCKTRLYAGLLQLKIRHVHSTALSHTDTQIHTNTDIYTRSVWKRINQRITPPSAKKKQTCDTSIHCRWCGSRVNLILRPIHKKRIFTHLCSFANCIFSSNLTLDRPLSWPSQWRNNELTLEYDAVSKTTSRDLKYVEK